MDQKENTALAPPDEDFAEQEESGSEAPASHGGARRPEAGGGLLTQYKPEQGWYTRVCTFIGAGVLVAWGAKFLNDRLKVFEGDEGWRLLITPGIPLLVLVLLGAFAWWFSFVNAKASDFMIATEGEMKKVSWSSRREVVGSTKVVILFTLLFSAFLFLMDVVAQQLFSWIGVLKSAS